jgi:hypothetical protein
MSWTVFAVAVITLAPVVPAAADIPRLACGGSRANVSETSVLIGGMEDSWRSLDGWAAEHASAGRRVCGYEYDSGRHTMSEAAARLERDLDALASSGTRRLYITAYSMGGWIAKAALDSMARRGTIQWYERVELVALGTPWGGYTRANLPWHLRWFPLPGVARGIARMVQRPMAFEVGASSSFVRERQAPLPGNVDFVICDGGADHVARPRTAEERANYSAVVNIATRRVSLPGATHVDLRRAASLAAILR